jgi:aspartate aminotransferase
MARMNAWAPPISPRCVPLRQTAVNTILAEVRAAQARGAAPISLMRGEPDFRTPQHVSNAAADALRSGRTNYADNRGELKLREAIALKLKRDNSLLYNPASEILVTTGATFGIHAALTTLLSPDEEVLLPDPIYDAYQSPIFLAGGRVRTVRSTIEHGRFTLPIDALEEAITPASRVLLLNTPWNPTGTVFTEAELTAIGQFVLRHNLVLISDEIYEAIVYGGHRHLSPAALSREVRERTIIINSLSKTYAMTGWRVGYCAGPQTFIDPLFLVLQQSSRGPATFVQDAAAFALSGPQRAVDEMRSEYTARREQVIAALDGVPRVRVLPPEGGFFAMLDVRAIGLPSNEIRRRLLNEAGVVVVHGSAYGEGGEGTLRVSFASGGETLTKGLERLREGLARL